MSKLPGFVVLFALAILALTPWTSVAQKEEKGDKVKIPTIDGVDLYARFYACTNAKTKNPPTVLMLHPLGVGEKSSKKNWVALAEKLQAKASVLTFDFRGHGLSTDIEPATFWQEKFNRMPQHIKDATKSALANKATLEFKELEKTYYPAIINDIAACKAYLDRKNDSGACNTSSFILVGAESGATLGAIWLNSEWHRHRLVQHPVTLLYAPHTQAEGQDVIACVWLSIGSQLGSRSVAVGSTLDIPLKQRATPMVFIYGEEDEKSRNVAKGALKFKTQKDKAKYAFTDAVVMPKTKLAGVELLQKSLGVDQAIYDYLFGNAKADGVIDSKGREWTERDFRKTQYVWRLPNTPPNATGVTAKRLDDKNFLFNDYLRYLKQQ